MFDVYSNNLMIGKSICLSRFSRYRYLLVTTSMAVVCFFSVGFSMNNILKFNEIEMQAYDRSVQKKKLGVLKDHASEITSEVYLDLLPTLSLNRNVTEFRDDDPTRVLTENSISFGYNLKNIALLYSDFKSKDVEEILSEAERTRGRNEFQFEFRRDLISLRRLTTDDINYRALLDVETSDFEATQNRYEKGALSKLDYLRAKDSLDDIRNQVDNIGRSVQLTSKKFQQKYDLDDYSLDLLLKGLSLSSLDSVNIKAQTALLVKKITSISIDKIYEVEKARLRAESLQHSLEFGRSSYFPDAKVSYTKDIDSDSNTLSFALSYDISTALKDGDHFKERKKNYLVSSFDLETARKNVRDSVVDLTVSLETKVRDYYYSLTKHESAKEIFSLSKESYSKGKIDSTAYYSDWGRLVNATLSVNRKKHDLMNAINEGELFTGKLSKASYLF